MSVQTDNHNSEEDGQTRRDFLMLTAGAFGAVGAGCFAWPFIDSLNPAADTLAMSTTEVDLTPNSGRAGHYSEMARQTCLRASPHRQRN